MIGLVAVVIPGWVAPTALAGAIFYLLAGLQHWRNGERGSHENIAMVSDLGVGLVHAAYLVLLALHIG